MAKVQQKQTLTEEEKNKQIYSMVDDLVKRSHVALDKMANFTQEQVDKICEAIATAGEQNAYPLAKMAVEETQRGVVEDKTTKNMYASENIWNSLRHEKTVGVIEEDKEQGLIKIAEPKGVIAGVTPVTNPTSTVIFKTMLALKTRNTIIFGFHPQAQKCCVETAKILQKAAVDEQQRFEVIAKALDALRQERSLLLKGKSADEAEAAVARREKELNEALEKARKQVEGVQNHLSGLQGEMKQLSVVIEELREQQKGIEFPEQLPQAIAKQQEDNLNTERTLSTAEARLLQQAKNKTIFEQITKELTEKQAVAVRWAKLNKLIGSADGAKFKVIAQSYTLNLLLLHANKHLAYLSKRYKLQQVPDTLALQVIDCDMCDEIRTVYSLSGGESFLISLALALGLSSLSSNNLKVESLFIDEGFGSLDADSLRTAMEALEQLQMQGRKIGVISHVQEMSERISVQVQVHKKINGKSVLTVVG